VDLLRTSLHHLVVGERHSEGSMAFGEPENKLQCIDCNWNLAN
jgi:hypothetical protein